MLIFGTDLNSKVQLLHNF